MALGFSSGRYILNGKLDFLRSRISLQKRYQHKGPIQSGRHASSADDTVQASVTSPVLPMRTPAAPHSRAPVQTENKVRTTFHNHSARRVHRCAPTPLAITIKTANAAFGTQSGRSVRPWPLLPQKRAEAEV